MAELYQLQEQEIPEAMGQLQDSHVNLKKVADYCEGLYIQADPNEKRAALEETRKYTTQALASVAYQINTLATSFLSLLDLQANQLVEMETNINHLAQTVAIHKEKVARREIGVLTTSKSFYRPVGVKSPGIIFPEQGEKQTKYVRKPIDFAALDGVGHGGVKTSHKSSVQRLESSSSNRSGSHTSLTNQSSSASTGTINVASRQYGVGMSMRQSGQSAPPVAPPTVPSHYMSSDQLRMAQQPVPPMGNVANPLYGTANQIPPPPAPMDLHNGNSALPSPLSPPLPPMPQDTYSQDLPPPPIESFPSPVPDFPAPDFSADNDDPYDGSQSQRSSLPMPAPPPLSTEEGADPPWAPANYIEKVIAIYVYEQQNPDELSFDENTVIYVMKKNADGWWEGEMELNGSTVRGLFPENYVEPLL